MNLYLILSSSFFGFFFLWNRKFITRIFKICYNFFGLGWTYWKNDYGKFKTETEEEKFYEKFVLKLEKMGPCFIKFGQWMAMRPDLFSKYMREHR